MKLGLMTAAFGGQELEYVASWAVANGYGALEIACWPSSGGEARRYAGVCHIDVDALDDAAVQRVHDAVGGRGLEISSLAYYPNPLDPDPACATPPTSTCGRSSTRPRASASRRSARSSAATSAAPTRRRSRTSPRCGRALVRYAGDQGVNIAIENCPMIFSSDEWPGGKNFAYSPAIWRELFRLIPDGNFGLNLDPSHLVWLMIDYERAVYDFKDRILHVHAKDLEINRDGLYEHGTMSLGRGWQVPRLPGLGEVRWDRFISALWAIGYDGVVSVEHEDRRFEGDLELVERGFVLARNVLAPYLV